MKFSRFISYFPRCCGLNCKLPLKTVKGLLYTLLCILRSLVIFYVRKLYEFWIVGSLVLELLKLHFHFVFLFKQLFVYIKTLYVVSLTANYEQGNN